MNKIGLACFLCPFFILFSLLLFFFSSHADSYLHFINLFSSSLFYLLFFSFSVSLEVHILFYPEFGVSSLLLFFSSLSLIVYQIRHELFILPISCFSFSTSLHLIIPLFFLPFPFLFFFRVAGCFLLSLSLFFHYNYLLLSSLELLRQAGKLASSPFLYMLYSLLEKKPPNAIYTH